MKETFGIRTTAPGCFGPEGIAPIGERRDVTLEQFSAEWMIPATQKDALAYRRLMKAAGKIKEPDPEDEGAPEDEEQEAEAAT